MTRSLLDTSAYSAHLRDHPGVKQALREAEEIYVSVIILGELRDGFLKGTKTRRNEALLRKFISEPRVQVLPVDEETSERYAVIYDDLQRRGTPVSVNDVWIAATAFQHGLRLLTLDDHFRRIPQIIVDFIGPSRGEQGSLQ